MRIAIITEKPYVASLVGPLASMAFPAARTLICLSVFMPGPALAWKKAVLPSISIFVLFLDARKGFGKIIDLRKNASPVPFKYLLCYDETVPSNQGDFNQNQ